MSSPASLGPIAELLERSLSIRHVYGEPVQHGDTTVIPVAQVAYGFGAGGGQGPARVPNGTDASHGGAAVFVQIPAVKGCMIAALQSCLSMIDSWLAFAVSTRKCRASV